jgi:hypothetical protein
VSKYDFSEIAIECQKQAFFRASSRKNQSVGATGAVACHGENIVAGGSQSIDSCERDVLVREQSH